MMLCLLALATIAKADQRTETIQQKLKDQGFYYGEVNGRIDADTAAAVRRYQIRNGLKVSGEVDAETAKSLSVGAVEAKKTPSVVTRATPISRAPEDTRDLRADASPDEAVTSSSRPATMAPPTSVPSSSAYAPGPRGLRPEVSGLLDGTPYEVAPPEVQRRVILGAQSLLARRGFYRSGIDGVYGPGMQFALRAYQARAGLEPSGFLDMDTLASLGLLPGQRVPESAPRRRILRPRTQFAPSGEFIYEPNN